GDARLRCLSRPRAIIEKVLFDPHLASPSPEGQNSSFQPEEQGNPGPLHHEVSPFAEIREGFTQRSDRHPASFQPAPVSLQRLGPPAKMHLQAVSLLNADETLPAEIAALESEGSSGVRADESPAISEWMHNGNYEPARGAHDAPDLF